MWRFLGSARLALAVVSLLALFFGAAAVIGKEVLSSGFFAGFLIAFAINVTVCTLRRAARILREERQEDNASGTVVYRGQDRLLAAANAVLAGRGYRVRAQAGGVLAEKYRFARWGPVLLHLGFLVVLAGTVASVGLRTEGQFRIVEGQTFTSPVERYLTLKQGVWAANPPRFTVRLSKVRVSGYTEGAVVGGEFFFLEEGRPPRTGVVETGKPAAYRGLTFHEEIFGYTVGVVLNDLRNGRVYPLRVSLETVVYPGGEKYEGQLQVPGSPYNISVEFFPTVGGTAEAPRMASYEPRDPAVFLRVTEHEGKQNLTIYEGVLRPGQSAGTKDFEVRFDHYLQWLGINVVRDPGRPVIYAGSALSILGLVLIYLVVPRRFMIKTNDGTIDVKGWAPRFGPLVAEEALHLKREIERHIKVEVPNAGN